jgi:hypothetical protein
MVLVLAGNGLGFYSSGGFTFRNSTLTTTLFSVDSAGSMSFNGTVFPAQGVSTLANLRGELVLDNSMTGATFKYKFINSIITKNTY